LGSICNRDSRNKLFSFKQIVLGKVKLYWYFNNACTTLRNGYLKVNGRREIELKRNGASHGGSFKFICRLNPTKMNMTYWMEKSCLNNISSNYWLKQWHLGGHVVFMKSYKCIYIVSPDLLGLDLGLWCLTPLSTIFQLYRGGNRSTRRKSLTWHKK